MTKIVMVKVNGIKELDSAIIEDNGQNMTALYQGETCKVKYNKYTGLHTLIK